MAKANERLTAAATAVARAGGRALGRLARAADAAQTAHPDPAVEVGEVLAAGVGKLEKLAADVRKRKSALVERTTSMAGTAKTLVDRARKRTKAMVRRPKNARAPVATAATRKQAARAGKAAVAKTRSSKPKATSRATPKAGSTIPDASPRTAAVDNHPAAAANLKRRQAHAAGQGRRRQARRDNKG